MNEDIASRLASGLRKKPYEQIASVISDYDELELDLALLKMLVKEQGMTGVLLTLDRPHTYFVDQFKLLGINPDSVHFVAIGTPKDSPSNCTFVESPGDLTSLGVAMKEAMGRFEKSKGGDFLIFDAIPTLSLYNDVRLLGRFLHDMALLVRQKKFYTVFLLEPSSALAAFVVRFCDTNLHLTTIEAEG